MESAEKSVSLPVEADYQRVYDQALRFLARRAHSTRELAVKLQRKGASVELVDRALGCCRDLGLLDEARFAKNRAEYRILRAGFGPLRVQSELRSLGVDADHVDQGLHDVLAETDLVELAAAALRKKFGDAPVLQEEGNGDWVRKEIKRRHDFLRRRGFDGETIRQVLP